MESVYSPVRLIVPWFWTTKIEQITVFELLRVLLAIIDFDHWDLKKFEQLSNVE